MTTPRTDRPLYQQVKDFITGKIEAGDWPPGSRIPSEHAIVESLGVSRMTANRAVRELSAAGRLDRVQGAGTFVAKPREPAALLEIRSVASEIDSRGGTHTAEVIAAETKPASEETAQVMQLAPGDPVFHVVVVHFEDGRAIQLEDRYVNPAAAPEFMAQDFTDVTPSQYLIDHVVATDVEHVVEARRPHEQECAHLAIEPDDPCLVLHRRTWAGANVVTRVVLVHPGALYQLGGRFKPAGAQHALVA